MAKALKQTLVDIADAIRAKDGTTTLMTSQEMPARIAAIPSGGGGETPPYDVNHYYPARFSDFTGGEAELHQYLKSGGNQHLYTNMNSMFKGSDFVNFDIDLDMANVTSARYMFSECNNLIQITGALDTSKITDAKSMFSLNSKLVVIPMLNFSSLINGDTMFSGCETLVHNTGKYIFPKANSMEYMFNNNKAQKNFNIEAPVASSIRSTFAYCSSLETVTITAPLAENCSYMLDSASQLTTANINIKGGNCSRLFTGCNKLTNITLNTSSGVTDATRMFNECGSLKKPPLFSITGTSADSMFAFCTSLEIMPEYDFSTVTNFGFQLLSTNNLKEFNAYNIGADIKISNIKSNGGQTISHALLYNILKALNNTSGTTKTITMSQEQYNLLDSNDKRVIAAAGFNAVVG